jgi:hypothetical protein
MLIGIPIWTVVCKRLHHFQTSTVNPRLYLSFGHEFAGLSITVVLTMEGLSRSFIEL